MPWHIRKSTKCPVSKPWGVFKTANGELEGCHPTEDAAKKQLAALYASEGKGKAAGSGT